MFAAVSLNHHIAVPDEDETIVAVNDAWPSVTDGNDGNDDFADLLCASHHQGQIRLQSR